MTSFWGHNRGYFGFLRYIWWFFTFCVSILSSKIDKIQRFMVFEAFLPSFRRSNYPSATRGKRVVGSSEVGKLPFKLEGTERSWKIFSEIWKFRFSWKISLRFDSSGWSRKIKIKMGNCHWSWKCRNQKWCGKHIKISIDFFNFRSSFPTAILFCNLLENFITSIVTFKLQLYFPKLEPKSFPTSFFPISIRTFQLKIFQLLLLFNCPFQLHVSRTRLHFCCQI